MDFADYVVDQLEKLDPREQQRRIEQFNKSLDPLVEWAQKASETLSKAVEPTVKNILRKYPIDAEC